MTFEARKGVEMANDEMFEQRLKYFEKRYRISWNRYRIIEHDVRILFFFLEILKDLSKKGKGF